MKSLMEYRTAPIYLFFSYLLSMEWEFKYGNTYIKRGLLYILRGVEMMMIEFSYGFMLILKLNTSGVQ